MSKARPTTGAKTLRSSSRAQAQRMRILDAASKCFVEQGFHAAGMADIAATAEMSVGLLYRYFKNKSAIVNAMIAQCLEDSGHILRQLETRDDMLRATTHAYDQWCRGDDPKMNVALMLEITAEVTRDRQIAAAARKKDRLFRQQLEDFVRRTWRLADPGEVRGRAMLLHALLDGLAVRAIREPKFDRTELRQALQRVLMALV